MKLLKFIFIILLITSSNNLYAKPVPPGAGDGEVAANILFLVDTTFTPIRRTPAAGCTNMYDVGANTTMSRNIRRNAGLHFVENLTTRDISNENVFFVINRERRDRNMIYGFTEDGTDCRIGIRIGLNRAVIMDIDVSSLSEL